MSKGKDRSRDFFPKLLNDMNLIGMGAEIGVFEGWHSKLILQVWKGNMLYAIDPWDTLPAYRDGVCLDPLGMKPGRKTRLEAARKVAVDRLIPYFHDRCRIIVNYSHEAAPKFGDTTLDWVYIDGRHYREGIQQDLELWYPKVKIGGVIAGHDYYDSPKSFTEVKSTVDSFFNNGVIKVETGDIPSWYTIKE